MEREKVEQGILERKYEEQLAAEIVHAEEQVKLDRVKADIDTLELQQKQLEQEAQKLKYLQAQAAIA